MLNNREFVNLERQLWRDSNPLCDELVSTRDELLYLLSQSNKVIRKYSRDINKLSVAEDLEYFHEWDNLVIAIENLTHHLGE